MLAALHAARDLQIVPATEDFTNQIVEKQVNAVVQTAARFRCGGCPRGKRPELKIYEYEGGDEIGFCGRESEYFFSKSA